jgi:hypothetical protein
MGLWLSIAIPSKQIALILAPPITLFFMISKFLSQCLGCIVSFVCRLTHYYQFPNT